MTTVIVLLLVGIIVGLVVWLNWRTQKNANKAVMHCLPLLYSMVGQLQKHRGMNASYLQGNTQAKQTLQDIQTTVAQIQSELASYPIIASMERWVSYLDHWSRLSVKCTTLNIESSFKQHTAMVENLLYMLEDLADAAPLIAKDSLYTQERVNLLWRDLPLLVECIGQCRAIGMPIATRQEISQIESIKIAYLRDKIDNIATVVFRELENQNHAHASITNSIHSAKSSCAAFILTLNQEFLTSEGINISPDNYFHLASQSMNTVNDVLKSEVGLYIQ